MQRTGLALVAVVMIGALVGLGGAVSAGGARASAAPHGHSSKTASESSGEAEGEVSAFQPTKKFVTCVNDGGFVERGANQTVPRLDVATKGQPDDVIVGPVIAWKTVSNAFGSRAVESMFIVITPNFFSGKLGWRVTWYCTSDRSKAWLVFGNARTVPNAHSLSAIPN
jgi:hypothetical protein